MRIRLPVFRVIQYDGMMNQFRAIVLIPLLILGCGRPTVPAAKAKAGAPVETIANIDIVREELKRPFAEPDQLRYALDQLSSARGKSPPLDASICEQLKTKLGLTDADLKEINPSEYGPLDSHLVYQGLFFADVARTLEMGNAPAVDKAKAALAWVSRHVRLEERDGPPDPPALVTQRGSGTWLERTYVMAALCQALELHAFLVGDADAAENTSRIWGIGIIQGEDVYLFDARLGIDLPGAKGVATLRELAQDASSLQSLANLQYDVTPDRLKSAKLFLSIPLTALAPRMKAIGGLAPPGTTFSVDAKRIIELTSKFPLVGWEPKTSGTPLRLLFEFLPPEEGGIDRPLPGQPSRASLYTLTLLPWDVYPPFLSQIPGGYGNFLRQAFVAIAGCDRQQGDIAQVKRQTDLSDDIRRQLTLDKESPTDPRMQKDIEQGLARGMRAAGSGEGPSLRQLVLRGQFREATEFTDAKSSILRKIRNHDGMALAPAVEDWAQKVRAAFQEGQQAVQRGDAPKLAAAERTLAGLRSEFPKASGYVQWLASGPALAKLAFLTATVKHDQAFQNSRHDPSPAVWNTAIQLWRSYLQNYPNTTESFHAQRMLADALAASGQKNAAAEAYKRAAAASKINFDKMACLYLATVVEK
jgi:hypothetical protein